VSSKKQDEKMMILKMLDEGKITLEEANELLDALYTRHEEEESEKREEASSWSEDFKKGLENLKEDVEKEISGVRKTIIDKENERTEETGNVGNFLKNILDSFSFGFIGGGYSFTEKRTGKFSEISEDPIEVIVETRNGHIDISGTDSEEYNLEIDAKVRGENEEKALEKKEKGIQIQEEEGRLRVRVTEREIMANIKLCLPQNKKYILHLDTSNGSVEVDDLNSEVQADTSNGRIVFQNLKGRVFKGDTSNGRIEMKKIDGQELIADTSNGSVFLQGRGRIFSGDTTNGSITITPELIGDGVIKADTSNGRIKINLPREMDIGYRLQAKTSMGSLNIEIPDLEYQERQETHSRKNVTAKSRNYDEKEKKVRVEASTSMGSLHIG